MEDEDFDIRSQQPRESEKDIEKALRPLAFDDFSGQDKIISNLRVFVEAARLRGEAPTIRFSMALRAWGRPRSRISWPMSLG